jgi:hypothetical protein
MKHYDTEIWTKRKKLRAGRYTPEQVEWIRNEYAKNDRPPMVILKDFKQKFGVNFDYADFSSFLEVHNIPRRDKSLALKIAKSRQWCTLPR